MSVQNPRTPSSIGFCWYCPHQSATAGIVKSTTPQLPPQGQGISYDLPVRLSFTKYPRESASRHCLAVACEIPGSCDTITFNPSESSYCNIPFGFVYRSFPQSKFCRPSV